MKEVPDTWQDRLAALDSIDWSKKNKDWDNACIVANSALSNRQARSATKTYLKYKLGLKLTDAELKTVSHLAVPVVVEGDQE